MDGFTITIILIFLGAILGAVLNARMRDRCLKNWHEYHVTVEEKDGDTIWGTLKLFPTGLELEYYEAVQDKAGHYESSYIIYKDQYPNIQAIYRYPDDLIPEQNIRRTKELEALRNQAFLKRFNRRLRNTFSILKDAFGETFNLVLGKVKSGNLGSIITKQGSTEVEKLSKNIIGYVGTSFDPLLEKHLYRRVVMEMTKGEVTTEYAGILKEYSSQFLEVVAVKERKKRTFKIPVDGEIAINPQIRGLVHDGKCVFENKSDSPLYVQQITGQEFEQKLSVIAAENTTVDFTLPNPIPKDLELTVEVIEEVDMIVPRTHALIRHSAEREKETNAIEELLKMLYSKRNQESEY